MSARFSHIFMLTSDLVAERRLLVDVIGLEVVVEEGNYLRVGGGGGFDVGLEEGSATNCEGTEITIEVDDVDAVYERLVTAGVPTEGRPGPQEWGARHVWFADVDGRRLSVFAGVPGT